MACKKWGKSKGLKSNDPSRQRNKISEKTDCPFQINVTYSKLLDEWRIGNINWNHNHALDPDRLHMLKQDIKFTKEMMTDIRSWTNVGNVRYVPGN